MGGSHIGNAQESSVAAAVILALSVFGFLNLIYMLVKIFTFEDGQHALDEAVRR